MNELPRTLASSGGATVDEIGGLTIDLRREEPATRKAGGRPAHRSFGVLRHLATTPDGS
jgi:hypothetical protein